MGLNAKNEPKSGGNNVNKQEPMEAGTSPARVVQLIDLGLQAQRPYKGEEKKPVHEIKLTYEFLDEFCLDEDGNEIEDKPRWLSEDIAFHNLDCDLAKSTKRYNALDPKGELDGDFEGLVGLPCMVTVVNKDGTGKNKGRVFNNVGNVAGMRSKDAAKAPQLVNPPKIFLLANPDMEIFKSLPDFIQDKIKGNLEFKGSALDVALNGGEEPKEDPKAKDVNTDKGDGDEW